MPVPKRKRSRSRRDKRFANKGIKVKALAKCQNCQSPLAAHQACPACGFYKGVKVLVTKAERAVRRGEERQARAKKKGMRAPQEAQQPQEVAPEQEPQK